MKKLFPRLHAAFHETTSRDYQLVEGAVWVLIAVSIGMLILEGALAEGHPAVWFLKVADKIVLALFALEIILRVGTYSPPALKVFKRPPVGQVRTHITARLGYLLSPMMLVDVLAVLALIPELRGLRALRLLRLLRTVRIFRYGNPFATLFHAFESNSLLFTFAFTVLGTLVGVGGSSIYLVESKAVGTQFLSLGDGMWWALVTLTTVGFGDITPVTTLGRLVGSVLMIAGMFTLALFAGIVGHSLLSAVLIVREEQFRMTDHVNHIVVCEWHDGHMLIDALRSEIDPDETRIVVMEDHDERPHDLSPDVLWVRGDPTKESELDKVRLTHAAAVIVSGPRDVSPQIADARTILTVFTMRSFLRARHDVVKDRHRPLYIVAEILDSENVAHARTAGADEVIETRRLGSSLLAHAVRFHGSADVTSRVLLAGAHNLYVGRIPQVCELPMPYGDLLRTMELSKKGGLIIGLRDQAGKEVLNPSKDVQIAPGTLLVYIAEDALLDPP